MLASGDALALAVALDPVQLARQCGIEPDPWQRAVLMSPARQICMVASRQSGKSTIAATLGTYAALTIPDALVLLIGPAVRQAQELFRKCRDTLMALGPDAPETRQESAMSLEFARTGSRIVVVPGDERTSRGFSKVTVLIIDEASRVLDEVYQSLRPALAVSQGKVVLLSTPNGARGFLWEAATGRDTDWLRVRVTADQCPRIDPRWLAAERERIGRYWFAQEFLAEFVDTDSQLYRTADVEACIRDDIVPLFPLRGAA